MTIVIEPATRVPRRGGYRARYLAGLAAVVLGVAATNLTSTYSLFFLLLGPVVQLTGWLVLPGALWRRLVVIVPGLVAGLVLIGGPDFAGAWVVLLAGWLFVRHRPALSYLAVLPLVVTVFLLKFTLSEYSQNWLGLLIGAIVTVGCAWAAAWLSSIRPVPGISERMPSVSE